MEFTKNDSKRLQLLIGKLMLLGEMFSAPNSPHTKTIHQLVNETSIPTLKGYYKSLNKVITEDTILQKLEFSKSKQPGVYKDTPWENEQTPYMKRIASKRKRWLELILLIIRYKLYSEEQSKLRKAKLEADKKVETMEDAVLTPKKRLKKAKQERDALDAKTISLEDDESDDEIE